jgi:hypothetical protein
MRKITPQRRRVRKEKKSFLSVLCDSAVKTMKQNTHKMQAEDLRIALKEFLWSERQVRDLLLYYTPPSTLQRHQRVVKEIKSWFDSGTFRLNGKDYPFAPVLLKDALKVLRTQPGFTPPGNESTGYLKKTMRTLVERKQQQRKTAGVQIIPSQADSDLSESGEGSSAGGAPALPGKDAGESPVLPGAAPGSKGDLSLRIVVGEHTPTCREQLQKITKALYHLKLKELEAVKGVDVSEVKATLEGALETGTVSKGFFEALDRHLMETVREQIGAEWDRLHEEVKGWFVEYRDSWTDEVMQETIEAGFRERLNERYGVPIW